MEKLIFKKRLISDTGRGFLGVIEVHLDNKEVSVLKVSKTSQGLFREDDLVLVNLGLNSLKNAIKNDFETKGKVKHIYDAIV